ncbi:MAG: DEAD/DEAH box helicase [Gammaproteobacteria bacterium]|nr:DEAD/DEAH box helicase [Gammaproteobacteria bacterium]
MSSPSPSPLTFDQLALAAPVLKAVADVGYEIPSPIQAESIPPLLEGRDLVGQAQTGTGKTAAFALPLLSRLDMNQRQPQLLILAPTRELAIQVSEACQTYARHMKGFHVLPIYGGQSMSTQLRQLKRGAQVIVGTPGRVMDHLRRKTLDLSQLRALVLDEADEMLKMGFIDDVEWILEQTPETRQIALFSATMPETIRRIARRHLNDPIEIKIKTKTATVETISQSYWQVSGLHKLDALTRILEVEAFDAMIVFVRTKNATAELAEKLEARGYASAALNGDMNQALREKTVEQLKNRGLDIVVATDVAARGLDVERISHVVNYDIPYDAEAYVHRIGRTGRAGRKGNAILFVAPREKRMLRTIENATKQRITAMQLPTREDVSNRRITEFKQQIAETIESQDLGFFEELIVQYEGEHNVSATEIAAALAYLMQKKRPLAAKEVREVKPQRQVERAPRDHRHKGKGAAGRDAREQRGDRPRKRAEAVDGVEMSTYRIEVGREHGVLPKNIVGAIANEAGLENRYIGHIKLHDTYSTVDLPSGMPKEVFNDLKHAWVCNRKLAISVVGGGDCGDSAGKDRVRHHKKGVKSSEDKREKTRNKHKNY